MRRVGSSCWWINHTTAANAPAITVVGTSARGKIG